MSIRFLKTFIAVAAEGSFAAAADKLGLTQSAVSLQMKSLEEEFRTELFDRTLRRPAINARGRELLTRAKGVRGENRCAAPEGVAVCPVQPKCVGGAAY